MENSKRWHRAELLIFTIIAIINMLPFVAFRFFPSMDGASHLANSNIINQLVVHHNNLFHQFFQINPEPVPNWTYHFLISLFTLVMPAFLAEKTLLAILLIGTPFAFRNLVHTVSPKNTIFSFLIFPFTHSMFFFFGFFNFCMAIFIFLITLNYWLQHEHQTLNVKHTIIMTILVALVYFSHVVIFGILLIVIALHMGTGAILATLCKKCEKKIILRQFLKQTLAIVIAALAPLFLFVYFFYSRPGTREISFISHHELVNFLTTIRPLISFNASEEGKLTFILFLIFVIFAGIGLLAFIIRFLRKFNDKSATHEPQDQLLPGLNFWWLLGSLSILLVLYFKIPDAYGTASYTSLRIAFIFFIFAILWISSFRIPWYFGLVAAIAGLAVNMLLIRSVTPSLDKYEKLAVSCNKAADLVAPNSIVFPVYVSDDWFAGHFVDYIAVDKPVVMVYNYECKSGYFPVKYNEKSRPGFYLGNPAFPEKYINFDDETKGHPSLKLDYVFIVGHYDAHKDWFFSTLDKILSEDFSRVYSYENKENPSLNCSLYRNNLTNAK